MREINDEGCLKLPLARVSLFLVNCNPVYVAAFD